VTGSGGSSSGGTGSSGLSGACPVSLTQAATGWWYDGTNHYTQWSVVLTNLPQNPHMITFVEMAPAPSQASLITQFWSVTESNGNFEFPSWITANGGLSPAQSLTWGYVSIGTNSVNFQILNAIC
jgi:hypothetical protein